MTSQDTVALQVNGRALQVAAGTSVAAALCIADRQNMVTPVGTTRRSVQGEPRAPFCGMGICQECRVSIDGLRRLACQTRCADGMTVETTP